MEANKRVEVGKGALFTLFLVTMIDMIGFGIVIPFLTYLVKHLSGDVPVSDIGIQVGILMMSYSLAQFLFSPIWGTLSDRIGRRPVLMVGLAGNTVFFTMFGLANTLTMAFVARFLAGASNGNIAVARAYIGDVSSPSQLASRMGLIGAAFGLGFTIGPFIGGELSNPAVRWDTFAGTIFDTHPYLLPCIAASVLSMFSLFLAVRYLPESLDVEAAKKATPSRSWGQVMKNSLSNSKAMLVNKNVGSIIWVTMLYTFGFTILHAVFILYTQMDTSNGGLGFSEADNGRIFAVIGLTGILVQGGLIGPLTRKFGSNKLLVTSTILTGSGLILTPYSEVEFAWVFMILVAGLISVGNGLFQPSSSTLLTQYAKEAKMELGLVMGGQESLGAFARILGPLLGGYVWTLTASGAYPWSYHTAFHLGGALLFISGLLALTLKHPKPLEEE